MRILIGCEESQEITKAFRNLTPHEAFSCDLKPCSGGHPEWHIQDDVKNVLAHSHRYGRQPYFPQDGSTMKWDLFIVHPMCTNLCVSGARWFKYKDQQPAIDFFMEMVDAPVDKIAIENPVGIMSTLYRKPDQYIQPYEYGHPETKKTCLWLKNLPKLIPTNNVYDEMMKLPIKERNRIHYMSPSLDRGALRAKTYPGWANAMAIQWG